MVRHGFTKMKEMLRASKHPAQAQSYMFSMTMKKVARGYQQSRFNSA
jgi:hypothetical protein